MKNRLIILYCFIILVIVFLFLKFKIDDYNDIKKHNIIISKIYDNHVLYHDYLGYIEIPNYGIKRLIKKGTSKDILDSNYVGLMNDSLDNKRVVLAGHNIKNVFSNLHVIKLNSLIYINNYYHIYKYSVIKKVEINSNDINYLNKKYNYDVLILITCTNKNNKRLLVISKLISIN